MAPLVARRRLKRFQPVCSLGHLTPAARFFGRLPDRYFQAVVSGTGAIGAWEAALRLREDERFLGSLSRGST